MSHISFSELKIWNECPWKHKSVYIDKIKGFEGNVYTAFGSAIHSVCENKLLNENLDERINRVIHESDLLEACGVPGIGCRVKKYIMNKANSVARSFGLKSEND